MNFGNLLEEVKKSVDLGVYISAYSKVDTKGMANCPLHKETKPSLKVYNNQSWWCFGCQKGGDIVDFVVAMDNVPFKEAVNKLAYKAGLDPNNYKPKITRFNQVNKIIRLNYEVNKWQDLINLASEQIFIGCQLLNQELMVLLNIPWEEVDHKHYTKLHIKHQQWLDYCDQADKVLNLMRKELEKWQTKLAEAKKDG